jgi:D-glycero-D-manno-heptose 1,7-bisphosphate phosphatase
MLRGLILDRDGVINVDAGYVYRIEECVFVDGIFEVADAFAQRGFTIVIASNQSGIGRGYYSEDEFRHFMSWMKQQFAARGIPIAASYHCPDHPTEGIGVYRRQNPWRKPGPGMFFQAAEDFSLNLRDSWYIGDKDTDIEAGRAAGVGNLVWFVPDAARVEWRGDFWVVPRLPDIICLLDRIDESLAAQQRRRRKPVRKAYGLNDPKR